MVETGGRERVIMTSVWLLANTCFRALCLMLDPYPRNAWSYFHQVVGYCTASASILGSMYRDWCAAFSNVTINQGLHNQPIIKLHEWQITSSIKRLLALVFTQIMRFSGRVKHPPAYKEDLYITWKLVSQARPFPSSSADRFQYAARKCASS